MKSARVSAFVGMFLLLDPDSLADIAMPYVFIVIELDDARTSIGVQ